MKGDTRKMKTEKLQWGIIGAGRIAGAFAKGVAASRSGTLVAVGSRAQASAEAFGREYGVPRRHASYEALLADPEVQAVYIATPHPMHAEWAIKAAEAGKHILCEKPITLNLAEATAVVEAAWRHDVFLMEAFMYRCHPQTAKLVEILKSKAIGDVQLITATFSFHAGMNPEGRLFKNALGGGGIMDVGCYCTSMARLIAGVQLGKDYADPVAVVGAGRVGETGVDEYAAAVLKFPGDIVAQVATGCRLSQESVVRIYGTEGNILVPSPWFCSRDAGKSTILVKKNSDLKPKKVTVKADRGLYAFEADMVAAHVEEREAPVLRWGDTLGNMRTLDQWRQAVGVAYDADKAEGWARPVHKRPLAVSHGARMTYGRIEGLDKPVSRLMMGAMSPNNIASACVLYDHFVESGGNAFDTAYVYGGGRSEQLLGQWIKLRGNRKDVVVLGKGGHTPFCTPDGITSQLKESLARLQTDHLDIYLMHRDNPDVPVGEFVDLLNEHRRAGRVTVFGGSNWTAARLDEANDYARRKGVQGFAAVSNNISLARMVDPVWGGTLSFSDPASRAWLERSGMASLAWSSTARGFFVRGNPDDRSDAELARCWYSEDNFRRRDRARELAAERGVETIQIALAWVLHQPFNSFALFGPAWPMETTISIRALGISLTPQEVRWLALESDSRT